MLDISYLHTYYIVEQHFSQWFCSILSTSNRNWTHWFLLFHRFPWLFYPYWFAVRLHSQRCFFYASLFFAKAILFRCFSFVILRSKSIISAMTVRSRCACIYPNIHDKEVNFSLLKLFYIIIAPYVFPNDPYE